MRTRDPSETGDDLLSLSCTSRYTYFLSYCCINVVFVGVLYMNIMGIEPVGLYFLHLTWVRNLSKPHKNLSVAWFLFLQATEFRENQFLK
jgi:hypothetical protein